MPCASNRPDFAVLDRYLDLFEKFQGKPSVIVLYVWCRYTARGQAPLVSELDPQTGEVRQMEAPKFATPEGRSFRGPVFAAMREHLANRGLDKALMIGITGDFTGIRQDMVDFFKEVAPGMPWVSQGHGARSRVGEVPVGL